MDSVDDKPRLRRLLDHFSVVENPREAWQVAHPLPEILLLVVCASIAFCDDFDDIAAWGEGHLPLFLPKTRFDNIGGAGHPERGLLGWPRGARSA
jgi:DDE family transposase